MEEQLKKDICNTWERYKLYSNLEHLHQEYHRNAEKMSLLRKCNAEILEHVKTIELKLLENPVRLNHVK